MFTGIIEEVARVERFEKKRAGARLTIAAERPGGHEGTVAEIHRWMFIHDMIVVGTGPERPKTSIGGHIGAMAVQGFPFPTHSDEPGDDRAVLQDEIGLNACFSIGKRAAELAQRLVDHRAVHVGIEIAGAQFQRSGEIIFGAC